MSNLVVPVAQVENIREHPNADALLNRTFSRLTVFSFAGLNKRGENLWNCVCDCGGTTIVKTHNLTSGKTKSCGCIPTGNRRNKLEGEKFGKLLVIEYLGRGKNRESLYKCECECGNGYTATGPRLTKGHTKSCGCLRVGPRKISLTEREREKTRNIPGYAEWVFAVKFAGRKTCYICKRTRGEISAHHIDDYMTNPEKRLLVSNGVCLCSSCHKMFHHIYGSKSSQTKLDQLRSFYEHTSSASC